MTSLDPRFVAALHRLCAAMDGSALRWALTGSVGMALQGMPYTPHDVDVQSDVAGAYEMERRLAEYVVRPLALKESAGMRSHLGLLEIEGVPVEIIGSMQRPGATGWEETDIAPLIHYALLDGMRVPVLALAHEAVAYAAMGRAEKAGALRAWAAGHADATGITNYRLLSPSLATAGMPLPGQLALLAAQGYRAVINLARPDSPGAMADEAERVRALGMEYVAIPVIWEAPTERNLSDFYAAMDALRGQPVFVHCVINMRVSAFCYLYRVQRLGEPEPQARKDLLAIWDPDAVWEAFLADSLG
jgi:protein tyrosine phosphatase (PTP) superfamily phosphohydrolase (DUF442 family)